MQAFIIGAAGGIGTRLSAALARAGDQVTGMFRNPEHQGRVEESGATPVLGDLVADTVDQLAEKMTGHDAVVFAAGAHGTGRDQTTLIDGKGVEKAAQAAEQAGVRQFVLVSAFPEAAASTEGISDGYAHYLATKKAAEAFLVRTNLDWIIVRPGHLLDEPGDGRVTAGLALISTEDGGSSAGGQPVEKNVPRDDVAAFIVAALHEDALARTIVELTDGPTTAAEAATAVAASVGPRR
ncbi:SDR family oxidoreductase [Nesterenkonia sp. CL21]|uniref:NAD(P)-binding oxidoreductase n=1 Tax=Nesterenkonia sp. CL21 TaxID=3064894 RepID=UPI0028798F77|nr:NAD(P)-binding oxidoreductase [Nesterenkonia sp. CL21]MDS2171847.1 SDR family oxidoreductase [Nesterenkonia sp. CL21]